MNRFLMTPVTILMALAGIVLISLVFKEHDFKTWEIVVFVMGIILLTKGTIG